MVLVVLTVVALIGFMGLALDVSHLYITKTELQDAADACALSGAAALTGASSDQLTTAQNWGIAAGQANKMAFQKTNVVMAPADVTFSETLPGPYISKALAEATPFKIKYVRCTTARTGIGTWFMQVLGPGDGTVRATAVATMLNGQTSCAIPLAICEKPGGFTKGEWIPGRVGDDAGMTGNFKWILYPDENGSMPSPDDPFNADRINSYLMGPGQCNVPDVGTKVGVTGVKASIKHGWNSRFGIYMNQDPKTLAAVPDFTGFAYTPADPGSVTDVSKASWPEQANAFSGTSGTGNGNFQSARTGRLKYQGDPLSGLLVGKNGSSTANGSDRRLGALPIVNCGQFCKNAVCDDDWTADGKAAIKAWACVMMLHPMNENNENQKMWIEYLGLSTEAGNPCGTMGGAGGSSATGPLVPTLVQ
jgi:hypothetical protein